MIVFSRIRIYPKGHLDIDKSKEGNNNIGLKKECHEDY